MSHETAHFPHWLSPTLSIGLNYLHWMLIWHKVVKQIINIKGLFLLAPVCIKSCYNNYQLVLPTCYSTNNIGYFYVLQLFFLLELSFFFFILIHVRFWVQEAVCRNPFDKTEVILEWEKVKSGRTRNPPLKNKKKKIVQKTTKGIKLVE